MTSYRRKKKIEILSTPISRQPGVSPALIHRVVVVRLTDIIKQSASKGDDILGEECMLTVTEDFEDVPHVHAGKKIVSWKDERRRKRGREGNQKEIEMHRNRDRETETDRDRQTERN